MVESLAAAGHLKERVVTNGQLYARAMGSTLRIIEQVPRDQWHAPAPCTEWEVARPVPDDADQQTKLLALLGRRS